MNFKVKAMAAACAAAMGGTAFALGPTVTPDKIYYVSGSSAQLNNNGVIFDTLFDGTSFPIDIYWNTADKGKNDRAYFGHTKPGGTVIDGITIPTVIGGLNVLVVETGKGGSGQGVVPVARNLAVPNMIVLDNTCVSTTFTYDKAQHPQWNCATLTSAVPTAGVSDEEPNIYTYTYNAPINVTNTNTSSPVTISVLPSDIANLKHSSELAVVMGIIQTNNFPAGYALTRPMLNGIITGADFNGNIFATWDQVDPVNFGGASPLKGKPVVLEFRVSGSGTRAATLADFINWPCSLDASNPLLPYSAAFTPVSQNNGVVSTNPSGVACTLAADFAAAGGIGASECFRENSGSGDVTANINADFSNGDFAVGILTAETLPGASDNWHFQTVDGVAPTSANAQYGAYNHVVEQSFQYNKGLTDTTAIAFVTTWFHLAGAVDFIATGNPVTGGLIAGDLALDATAASTNTSNEAIAHAHATRQGNTCQPWSK